MKRGVLLFALGAAVVSAVAAAAFVGSIGPTSATASSHREAPLIADDPAADNTDVYAFVSPDKPNTVTIIANYIPFEDPAGGPNYYKFDPTVRYALNVDNNGDGKEDVAYEFRFKTQVTNPNTFLYNTGPISTVADQDTNLSVKQTYTVTRVTSSGSTVLGSNLRVPPTNIGRVRIRPTTRFRVSWISATTARSSPGRATTRSSSTSARSSTSVVCDRSTRCTSSRSPTSWAKDGVKNYNTHTIAIQVPKTDLLERRWRTATSASTRMRRGRRSRSSAATAPSTPTAPQVQVSRLGNPLINEVVIPLGKKDYWNASDPSKDSQFAGRYTSPELAALEAGLYPVLDGPPTTGRGDLVAVLLTGVPTLNFTGSTQADLLRLNTSFTAPPVGTGNRLGLLAGEFSGFPNGRRLEDDVTDIEIRAVACGYGPIIGPIIQQFGFCDGNANRSPNNVIGDGVDTNADNPFLSTFPYVAAPNQGYAHTGHK